MLLSLFALALAQESEPEPVVEAAPPPPTLAFVVSGGISRGSYLAGQGYVYGEAVKQSWPAGEGAPPIVFAGASAGTVSAVVGSMDLQLNPRATWVPEDSLHFRLWVGIGLHDGRGSLDNFQDQEPDGLYSTKGVQRMVTGITRLATGESGWAGRIRVGAQTSRVDPLEDDNIGRRILEPFALDLVDFEPHWLSSDLQRKGHRGSPDALGDLARASGAFPQAFPPVELKCSVEPDDRGRYGFSYADAMSPREERDCVGSILLMDGGVFDNNPVGLAFELSEAKTGSEVVLVYPDPDLAVTRSGRPIPTSARSNVRSRELGAIVSSARVQEIATFRRTHPDVLPWPVPQRTDPISTELGAFLGFYDTSFRVWDFYAGMVDAFDFLDHLIEERPEALAITREQLWERRMALRTDSPFGIVDCGFARLQAGYGPARTPEGADPLQHCTGGAVDSSALEALVEPTRANKKARRTAWKARRRAMRPLAATMDSTPAHDEVLKKVVRLQTVEWLGSADRGHYDRLIWTDSRYAKADEPAVIAEDAADLRLALGRMNVRAALAVASREDPKDLPGDREPEGRLWKVDTLRDLHTLGDEAYPAHDLRFSRLGFARIVPGAQLLSWQVRYRTAWSLTKGADNIRYSFGEDVAFAWGAPILTGSKRGVWIELGPDLGLAFRHQFGSNKRVPGAEIGVQAAFRIPRLAAQIGPELTFLYPGMEPVPVGPLAPFQVGLGVHAQVYTETAQVSDPLRAFGVPISWGPHLDLVLAQALRVRVLYEPRPFTASMNLGLKFPRPAKRRPFRRDRKHRDAAVDALGSES